MVVYDISSAGNTIFCELPRCGSEGCIIAVPAVPVRNGGQYALTSISSAVFDASYESVRAAATAESFNEGFRSRGWKDTRGDATNVRSSVDRRVV